MKDGASGDTSAGAYSGPKIRPFVSPDKIWILDALAMLGETIYGSVWTGKELDAVSNREITLRRRRIRSEWSKLKYWFPNHEWRQPNYPSDTIVLNGYGEDIFSRLTFRDDPSSALGNIDLNLDHLPPLPEFKDRSTAVPKAIDARYIFLDSLKRLLPDQPADDPAERRNHVWAILRNALSIPTLQSAVKDTKQATTFTTVPEIGGYRPRKIFTD